MVGRNNARRERERKRDKREGVKERLAINKKIRHVTGYNEL